MLECVISFTMFCMTLVIYIGSYFICSLTWKSQIKYLVNINSFTVICCIEIVANNNNDNIKSKTIQKPNFSLREFQQYFKGLTILREKILRKHENNTRTNSISTTHYIYAYFIIKYFHMHDFFNCIVSNDIVDPFFTKVILGF